MSQSRIGQYSQGLVRRPSKFDIVQRIRDAVSGLADDLGVPLDYFARRGGELDDDTGVLRWQYSTVYEYPDDHPQDASSASDYERGSVQFRTTLYTLSAPSQEVRDFLRDVTHQRLHALFDTGTYDGYMTGFSFIADEKHVEGPTVVGQDEVPATGLGVPNFAVEVLDTDGDIVGYSKGYSMDFGVSEVEIEEGDAPEQEVWRVRSFNEARGDYELSPEPNSPARERAKNANGKTAYINGMPVGSITSRGSAWLTKQYSRPGAATYQSRQQIIDATGTPYQALSPGSKLYKVRETADALYFSTAEPSRFDPAEASEVSESDTGLVTEESFAGLDDDGPTTFVVTVDQSDPWALGKYNTPTVREIESGQGFPIHLPGGG